MTKSTITREPITHYLKIYPEFFSAVCTGVKRAELRKNDRDYRVGDTLHLMETPRGSCHQTGEFINVKITDITDVDEWMPGYVLLSIEREALDSESVILYRERNPYNGLTTGWQELTENELSFLKENAGENAEFLKLYRHAQPAPVARDAATAIRACLSEFPESARDIVEECADIAENACRAAMIQAEPVTTANKLGNSPVIPDGSEHCPCCGKKLRRACSVEGCEGKHVAHGLCKKHYDMKRWEDPEQVRKFREAGKRYRRKTKSAAAAPQEVSHD